MNVAKLLRARLLAPLVLCAAPLAAQTPPPDPGTPTTPSASDPKLTDLARELERVRADLALLQQDRATDRARIADFEARQQSLLEELETRGTHAGGSDAWYERITLGGYGEIHLNHEAGPGRDQIDNHRFVAYLGYRFSDSIELHSETELEHSLVAEDGDGELALEQLYVDFRLDPHWNIRAGRFLTPLGIENQTHEPTAFNGVERSLFETVVVPSTWWSDGAGLFGELSPTVSYELYVSSSLDGSGFTALDGIREGRQEGTAGISEPAISGRVDWRAWRGEAGELRAGLWTFHGGLDNGPGGVDPGIDADLQIYGCDVRASVDRFDFRGQYAYEHIGGARDIGNGVASSIDGFNVEVACHLLSRRGAIPEGGRGASGRDLVAFVRYDQVDTQRSLPDGVARNPAGSRDEWTIGASYFPVRSLVIKADYQVRDDDAVGLPERINLGLGWSF